MHKNALDINAQFTADLSSPVAFNAGYESRASVAVPPREAQPLGSLFNQFVLPKGDVLSTLSTVKVKRDEGVQGALNGVTLDFISVAATGEAATLVTSKTTPNKTNGPPPAGTFAEAAANIVGK